MKFVPISVSFLASLGKKTSSPPKKAALITYLFDTISLCCKMVLPLFFFLVFVPSWPLSDVCKASSCRSSWALQKCGWDPMHIYMHRPWQKEIHSIVASGRIRLLTGVYWYRHRCDHVCFTLFSNSVQPVTTVCIWWFLARIHKICWHLHALSVKF